MDKNHEVLKKYNFKIYNIYRARGAFLLDTDSGLKIIKNLDGSRNGIMFEHAIKQHLYDCGHHMIDFFVNTIDGDIISSDSQGKKYYVKKWYMGDSCNLSELNQVKLAAKNLASLHCSLKEIDICKENEKYNTDSDLLHLFNKRNRELRRVRSYIRKKTNKNEFEVAYINYFDNFYHQGEMAIDLIKKSNYEELLEQSIKEKRVCHGNYTYHNIIMNKGRGQNMSRVYMAPEWSNRPQISASALGENVYDYMVTTNFGKSYIGIQIMDLYHFIRKTMEKNDWDILYGTSIIEAYNEVRTLSDNEIDILYILLLFPEKFWKITNFYFNNKKSWLSQRSIQKLNSVGQQEEKKKIFLKELINQG